MSGYEPLNKLKYVADGVWIVDGPSIRFYGLPFSTRMTIIRLPNGDLWLHSPTKLLPGLRDEVAALGRVAHLIAPNWIHYAYIAEWAAAFPESTAWAAPGVRERSTKMGMEACFDHDLETDPPLEWASTISQMIVSGSKIHRETVFFHHPSQTLILTDLIENFETEKIPLWMRPLAWFAGILDPDGQQPFDMRLTFKKGKIEFAKDVRRMIEWRPERVILAHGRWYDKDGVAELKRAFRWAL